MNPVQNTHATTPDKIRQRVQATVQDLLEKSARGSDVCEQLLECRQLVESLPLSTDEFGVAVLRLRNAHRYLVSDERGAAQYELRLLEGSLRNGDKLTIDPKVRKPATTSGRIQGPTET